MKEDEFGIKLSEKFNENKKFWKEVKREGGINVKIERMEYSGSPDNARSF